jgi:hypothetical protein
MAISLPVKELRPYYDNAEIWEREILLIYGWVITLGFS